MATWRALVPHRLRSAGVNSKNGPKVGNAAPRASDGEVRIWLYAGNPEYPPVLARSSGSDNPRGAGNQQGSPLPVSRHDPSETTRRTSAIAYDDMVPSAWRHAGTAALIAVQRGVGLAKIDKRNSLSGKF